MSFNDFRFVQANDAFRQCVVAGVADCTQPMLSRLPPPAVRCNAATGAGPRYIPQEYNGIAVLAAPVAVVRQSIGHPARVQRLLQRIKHQRRLHATHHPPADDIAAVYVDNEGGASAAVSGEVKSATHSWIWPIRAEVAFDQIRQVRTPFADGGALALAAPYTLDMFPRYMMSTKQATRLSTHPADFERADAGLSCKS